MLQEKHDNTTALEYFLTEVQRNKRTAMDLKTRKEVYFLDKKADYNHITYAGRHLLSKDNTLVGIYDEVYRICECGCNLVFDNKLAAYVKRNVNNEYDEYPKFETAAQTVPLKIPPVCMYERVKSMDVAVTAHPNDFFNSYSDQLLKIAKEKKILEQQQLQNVKKYDKRRTYEVVD